MPGSKDSKGAPLTIVKNSKNNLSPWKPGQFGNPGGGPRGARDLAGYVLESLMAVRNL